MPVRLTSDPSTGATAPTRLRIPPRAHPAFRLLGRLQAWALEHGVRSMRIWLGVVYFWFGALKFDPMVEGEGAYLPGRVVAALTLQWLDASQGTVVLAYWECIIGFCLVAGLWLRTASLLMLAHLLIMFLPAIFMPRQVWAAFPFLLTIKGQMVLDNLVLLACGLMFATAVPRGPPRRFLGRAGGWMRSWDDRINDWLGRHGILLLRCCLGAVYLWSGALKFVPGASAFEPLLDGVWRFGFGAGECALGAGLLIGRAPRLVLTIAALHLVASCAPLFVAPGEIWLRYPFLPTQEGKFFVRHLVLSGAALVVAAAVAQRASGWAARVNPFAAAPSAAATAPRSPQL